MRLSTMLSFHTMALEISAAAFNGRMKLLKNEGTYEREASPKKSSLFIRNTLKAYVCLE
jgi:hypothetical protein